jgi:anti-sigma B factor antagonist
MQIDPAEAANQLLTEWKVTAGQRALWVSGELDLASAPLLEAALEGEIEQGTDVTFDLVELGFIDAAGLGVLVGVRRTVGSRGRVLLRHPGRVVRRVLSLTGLDGADGFTQSPSGVPA